MLDHFDQNLKGSQIQQDLAEGKEKFFKSQVWYCGCLFGISIPPSDLQDSQQPCWVPWVLPGARSWAGMQMLCWLQLTLPGRNGLWKGLCLGKGSLSCSCWDQSSGGRRGNCSQIPPSLQGWSTDRMAAHPVGHSPFQPSFSRGWEVSASPNISEWITQSYRVV